MAVPDVRYPSARAGQESAASTAEAQAAEAGGAIVNMDSGNAVVSTWKLKRTAQCPKCPWLVETDPRDIPNGYCETKHAALSKTIAEPGVLATGPLVVMACHETDEAHCVGWLVNQLGRGNNIGLRLRMMTCENGKNIRLRGKQHECFEDTLP